MAFRFRKTIKIAPGLKVNLGKRGVSVSAGIRGASLTYGRGGLYGNTGLPGTGMSVRSKIGGPATARQLSARQEEYSGNSKIGAQLQLNDDGSVEMLDAAGVPLPPKYVKLLKDQKKELIQEWLEQNCDKWNKGIEAILNLHLETPPENSKISYEPIAFDFAPPTTPTEVKPGFIGRFFKGPQKKAAAENARQKKIYETALEEWEIKKCDHVRREQLREEMITKRRFEAPEGMQDFLSEVLSDIEWPRETLVVFEVSDSGKEVLIDVDFPEVEDMPTEQASVATRGIKINVKTRSETQCRKDYMQHIHAILFRIVGEVFVALPTVETVIASGFSQRPEKQTGNIVDEYLLSAKIERKQWASINFSNLKALSLPECFEQFELRRDMTKTGVFKAIQPIGKDV